MKSIDIYRKRINLVVDYVNANLDRSISLHELASVSLFSPYHFHRIFVAVSGESVHEFTNRLRLEKSAKLLRFSKKSISDVSIECGFSSPSTFSRAFRQYFECSPSHYRKNGKIENSKIRKELFPVDQYHCEMSEDEMRGLFPVKIKEYPRRRIAYMRVANSFEEGVVVDAFSDLVEWAKEANLFSSGIIFGMSADDPMITPKDKYIYEVGITIPEDFLMDRISRMETTFLPKQNYAVASVSGDFSKVATAISYLFNNWLINSTYEPEHLPGMEIFRDKTKVCDWSHFDLDLCIPIKKIKNL